MAINDLEEYHKGQSSNEYDTTSLNYFNRENKFGTSVILLKVKHCVEYERKYMLPTYCGYINGSI